MLHPPIAPMEARLVSEIPSGEEWQYEPKWDGFRCIVFKDGADIELQGKSGKLLTRFFPEVAEALASSDAKRFVLDGELVIDVSGKPSFDALQMRLHPAATRIQRLASETPARFVLFDCLHDGTSQLLEQPFHLRRDVLEKLVPLLPEKAVELTGMTTDIRVAKRWLSVGRSGFDGVVAKDLNLPYVPGERVMLKIKRRRTADCVVGGFRYETGRKVVGSLLLGLYDGRGLLHHVGFTSSLAEKEKASLTTRLEKLIEPPGFTGDAPGGPSRWATERSAEWEPLKPELVVEVQFDHVTGRRFRHGTRLLRWRPDKAPRQCTYEQLR